MLAAGMAHREATLNAWDAQLWLRIPAALAEVGSRLNAGNADYLGRLLELLEDAVTLATALALARLSAGRPLSDSLQRAAREHLERPSLGKRLQLLSRIYAEHPGAAGWDLDAAAEDFDDLFAVGRAQSPRRPRIRHVLDTLTTIRNDDAHRRLPHARRQEVARAVERAVFNLVRRNAGFAQRVLFVEQVRRTAQGGFEITARSLNGPGTTSYRRGHWQPIGAQQVLPQRVYLGETEALVDAHPFLVRRDERLYVLDQLRSAGPVLRHFYSRDELHEPVTNEWLARSPEPATPDSALETAAPRRRLAPPAQARDDVVPATPSLSGLPLPAWLGPALLGLGVAFVVALAMSAAAFYAVRPPTQDRAAAPHLLVDPPGCRGSLPEDLPLALRLPQIVSGAPISWGGTIAELEGACGPAPRFPFDECARSVAEMRSAPWPGELEVPQRRHTTLAFHHQRGLFEVMVFSDADAAELERVVAARLGPPHREEAGGRHRFWEYLSSATTVRVKVSRLVEGHPRGRSAIKMIHVPTDETYRSELRAFCAR